MRNPRHMAIALLLAAALRAAGAGDALPYAPLAQVSGFHAALRTDGQVVVRWRTTAEFGVEAFRVLRRSDTDGTLQAVGSGWIAANGEESGGSYVLSDIPAAAGTRRAYVLQLVSRHRPEQQLATWEGPLAQEAVAVPAARLALAAAPAAPAAPLGVSWPRPCWIGNGDRVRSWTNAQPADRVRLSLRDEGVYCVTAGELANASGWDLAGIASALATTNLSLSCGGAPVAWHAAGSNLFFYGLPPASRFAPENVYWVARGAGSNMPPQVLTPGEPATTNAWFIDQIRHQGTDYVWRLSYSSLAEAPASYAAFYPLLARNSRDGSTLVQVNEPLVDCVAGEWTGSVSVNLLSYYDSGVDNHAARVWIGGTNVGEPAWANEQFLSFAYPFASTDVVAGVAQLKIENIGTPDQDNSSFLCSSCTFTYPRCYRAQHDALRCTGGTGNTVTVSGFATNDILALDVTAPGQPQVIQPLGPVYDAVAGGWSVSFPCGGTDRVYAVCSAMGGVRQPAVRGVRDVDWRAPENAADYVILVPPEGWRADIRPVLQPLADFRNAQGLVTRIVDVESVYNQFSAGLVDPQAIRAFCGAGYTNWPGRPLRYVLLAGAGSLDFQHERLSVNDYTACLIPTLIAGQSFADIGEGMTTALDQGLGDVAGDAAPEVAIGRLPTTSTQDMAVVVGKTLQYERALLWKQQASVAADWDNTGDKYYPFSVATERCIPALTNAGRTVARHYPDPSEPSNLVQVRVNSLFPAFTSGSGLFHYFGHSNELSLGGSNDRLLWTTDISSDNWTKAMIAVVIGCRVNRWQSLSTTVCVVPYGVLAPDTGFVAALGATGYLLAGEGEDLGVALYSQAATHGTLRLGDVLKNGLQQMAGSMPRERLQCFTLTGDPALVFRHDITATGTPVAWLAAHGLTAPNADQADPDADGWPTWQEYGAGTDPTNGALQIASATLRPADNRFTLGFTAHSGGTYRVFFKESLLATGDWQAVSWCWTNASGWSAQAILPGGPVATVDVPATNTAAVQGFYRVCWTN